MKTPNIDITQLSPGFIQDIYDDEDYSLFNLIIEGGSCVTGNRND